MRTCGQVQTTELGLSFDPLSKQDADSHLKLAQAPHSDDGSNLSERQAVVRDRMQERPPELRDRMQERRWPDPDATAPFIMSGNFTHSILHPIASPLAALLVGPQVPLHLDLLRCRHEQLNLLVQNFRRTDRSPPPGSPGAATAQAFHQDSAFLGRHYDSTPVQSYYITMLALSPVRHGVAPFMVIDDSLRVAKCAPAGPVPLLHWAGAQWRYCGRREAAAALSAEEQQEIDGLGCRTVLPARLRADGVQAVIDAQPKGREVFLDAGDLLVLDPMTTHAGSPCYAADHRCAQPRMHCRGAPPAGSASSDLCKPLLARRVLLVVLFRRGRRRNPCRTRIARLHRACLEVPAGFPGRAAGLASQLARLGTAPQRP